MLLSANIPEHYGVHTTTTPFAEMGSPPGRDSRIIISDMDQQSIMIMETLNHSDSLLARPNLQRSTCSPEFINDFLVHRFDKPL